MIVYEYNIGKYEDEFVVIVRPKEFRGYCGGQNSILYFMLGTDNRSFEYEDGKLPTVMFGFPMKPKPNVEKRIKVVGRIDEIYVNSLVEMEDYDRFSVCLPAKFYGSRNIKPTITNPFDSKYFVPDGFDWEVLRYLGFAVETTEDYIACDEKERIKNEVIPRFQRPYEKDNICMRKSREFKYISMASGTEYGIMHNLKLNLEVSDIAKIAECSINDIITAFRFSAVEDAEQLVELIKDRTDPTIAMKNSKIDNDIRDRKLSEYIDYNYHIPNSNFCNCKSILELLIRRIDIIEYGKVADTMRANGLDPKYVFEHYLNTPFAKQVAESIDMLKDIKIDMASVQKISHCMSWKDFARYICTGDKAILAKANTKLMPPVTLHLGKINRGILAKFYHLDQLSEKQLKQTGLDSIKVK